MLIRLAFTSTEGRAVLGVVEERGGGRREIVEVFGLASMPEQGL